MEHLAGVVASLWYMAVVFGWVPLVVLLARRGHPLAAVLVLIAGFIYFLPGAWFASWGVYSDLPSHDMTGERLRLGGRLVMLLALGAIISAPFVARSRRGPSPWRASLATMITVALLVLPLSFLISLAFFAAFHTFPPFSPM